MIGHLTIYQAQSVNLQSVAEGITQQPVRPGIHAALNRQADEATKDYITFVQIGTRSREKISLNWADSSSLLAKLTTPAH